MIEPFAQNDESAMPTLSGADLPTHVTFKIFLDTHRPLSEPGWCKSGNVEDWLRQEFGASSLKGGWEHKIEVVDPDPVSKRHIAG